MTLSEVINLVEKHSPMVRFEDLKVLIELLNYTKPKSILELGTGAGGWILAINEALEHDVSFIGYENFKWDNIGQQFTDIKQLETQLQIVSNNNKILLKDSDVTTLDNLEFCNNLFDVVRLDCLEESNDINKLFYKIFPYTSDNCIFLVDDIVPNNCPNRFLTYMDKVSDGVLKPIWFGNKEGAWCKSTYNHNPLIDDIILNIKDDILYSDDLIHWYNLQERYIQTRGSLR